MLSMRSSSAGNTGVTTLWCWVKMATAQYYHVDGSSDRNWRPRPVWRPWLAEVRRRVDDTNLTLQQMRHYFEIQSSALDFARPECG